MREKYPICPECGNPWVGRLTAPGWYFCSTCAVEYKSDAEEMIVYSITQDGMRKRTHRKRRHESLRSHELSPT